MESPRTEEQGTLCTSAKYIYISLLLLESVTVYFIDLLSTFCETHICRCIIAKCTIGQVFFRSLF